MFDLTGKTALVTGANTGLDQGITLSVDEGLPLSDPTTGAHDVRAMMNNYRSLCENNDMRLERRFKK